MCDVDIDPILLQRYVKIFLSACDMFECKAYVMNGVDAMWYTKGNFLSLLNIPSQVSKFGSVRMYWEGSRERSIQQIKPFLINIRQTPSYFSKKLTYMYVNETLDTINKDILAHVPEIHTSNTNQEYDKHSSFKTYSASDDINALVSSGKVMSVVYLSLPSNNKFYICQRTRTPNKCVLFQVLFVDNDGFNRCGMWYAPIEVSLVNNDGIYTQNEVHLMSEDFAILCPCITNNEVLKLSYTVICKSWRYRNKYNELMLPSLSTNFFRSTIDDN